MKTLITISILFVFAFRLPAQWVQIYSDPEPGNFYMAAYFHNSAYGFVGGTGDLKRTQDGGITWENQYFPGSSFLAFHFFDQDTGYAFAGTNIGSDEMILRTIDGGDSWDTVSIGQFSPLYGVDFVGRDTGYASGANGYVVKTTDGGATWQMVYFNGPLYLWNLDFVNKDTGYAVGNNATILKTTDGGNSWNNLAVPTTQHFTDVEFINDSVGFVSGGVYATSGIILKTTDGGISWNPVIIPSGVINVRNMEFFEGTSAYAVCDGGVILKSEDGGDTWIEESTGTTERLFGLSYIGDGVAYASGENRSIFKLDNTFVGMEEKDVSQDVHVYPNPFSDHIRISTSGPKEDIRIYNMLGRLVHSQTIGKKEESIDLGFLVPGIYLLHASSGIMKIIRE